MGWRRQTGIFLSTPSWTTMCNYCGFSGTTSTSWLKRRRRFRQHLITCLCGPVVQRQVQETKVFKLPTFLCRADSNGHQTLWSQPSAATRRYSGYYPVHATAMGFSQRMASVPVVPGRGFQEKVPILSWHNPAESPSKKQYTGGSAVGQGNCLHLVE